jgi:hypothetical protein
VRLRVTIALRNSWLLETRRGLWCAMRHRIQVIIGAMAALSQCCWPALSEPSHGLRLLLPVQQPNGKVHLYVVSSDARPLNSARAERIAVLTTTNVALPSSQWPGLSGLRGLADGALRIEHVADDPAWPSRFFVARETALPRAVIASSAAEFREAMASAKPGTRVLLAPGRYPGGFFFQNLRGEPGLPIVIGAADPQNPPVLEGGANGIQLSDPCWVELEDLVFTGAAGNGLNIDDGGSFESPAHNVVLRRLRVTDVGPQGNRDGIKLSGVVDFRVEGCTIERWGTGGSAIDMVGCHRGVIESNLFRHFAEASDGANGVQTKGGSRDILIRRNRFEDTGARGVNIGGSTGLQFFRPPLLPETESWEAKDIRVEGNTFIGSGAPVAFVGVDRAVVRFNTIYRPRRWALRILQENTTSGFVPCRDGEFTDNIVAFHSSEWFSGGVNIGPNTAPATFQFARNWWFCLDDPGRSRPILPVTESAGVYGVSPQFSDPGNGDLRLQPGSPAHGAGAEASPELDQATGENDNQ